MAALIRGTTFITEHMLHPQLHGYMRGCNTVRMQPSMHSTEPRPRTAGIPLSFPHTRRA